MNGQANAPAEASEQVNVAGDLPMRDVAMAHIHKAVSIQG